MPPFAEEMNKSRRMFSLLANALVNQGQGCLLVDLYGTGDSAGDFVDARWENWREDIIDSLRWMKSHGAEEISIVALRMGALIALDVLQDAKLNLRRVVLWQPISNGKLMLSQFLRIRLAANLFSSNQEKETSKGLMQRLEQGQSVEVGGYELSADLYKAISNLSVSSFATEGYPPIHWIDVTNSPDAELSLASKKQIKEWRSRHVKITEMIQRGEPFWSLQEINVIPALIDSTRYILRS